MTDSHPKTEAQENYRIIIIDDSGYVQYTSSAVLRALDDLLVKLSNEVEFHAEAVKIQTPIIPENIPPFRPKIFHTRKPIKPFRKVNPIIRKNSLRDRRINKFKKHKRDCFKKHYEL